MMKQSLLAILLVISISIQSSAQKKYDQVWAALNNNDHPKATLYLAAADDEREKLADNYITNVYLKTYTGKQLQINDFDSAFYDKVDDPYPYIYALWFNDAVLGMYGKKKHAHQLRLIDKILNDPKAHGTLVAASHYQKVMHHTFSGNFDAAKKESDHVGNLRNWQYVGLFENLSHSGFYKNYGPLDHPDGKATFTSNTNAKVKWFSPPAEITDGWNAIVYQFHQRTGVVYAQTFVTSSKEQEILCNAGAGGALKVWINDALVLSEYTERVTEMDTYTAKCKLQKGVNRILVQLSFTDANYGNFSVRLTDKNYRAIPGLNGSSVYKPYVKAPANTAVPQKHFAESFFQNKINSEPHNLVNYLLLADVYLRNKKVTEARQLIEPVLENEPNNNLLRMKLVEILLKENNRTVMLEEVAKLRKNDPKALVMLEVDIQNAVTNQRLDEALEKLKEREFLYGEDLNTISYKLNFLLSEKKYNEFVSLAEETYKKYPDSPVIVRIMYSIRKEVYRDTPGALKVYEDFLSTNYVWEIDQEYVKLLRENGQQAKSLERRKFVMQHFQYDPGFFAEVAGYHFTAKEYALAEENVMQALRRSPYNAYYWELLGDVESDQNKVTEAVDAYTKSLQFEPNQYDVINKLRKLKGQSESYQLLPPVNVDEIINSDNPAEAMASDGGYYVIRNEKCVIMHPGGAVEDYSTYIVRVTNENGIDEFKESRIDYSNDQTLLIERSDVIKKSGTKIQGERNNNVVVFPNLEAGDIIVFQYRIQSYHYGRFRRDFWHKQFFGGEAYVGRTKFTLLAPAGQKIDYVFSNAGIKPVIKDVEDFKQYTWEATKQAPLKEESLMPSWVDVSPVLHLSTIPKWNDIAVWYADIINNVSEESYELKSVFSELFPAAEQETLTEFAKARRIYNYIEKNIRYSSVPFRQGSYLPQRASITLTTRLGDCKDLSNLFMTLCRMAKIEARMVLVNTRDNGAMDMVLPSLEFNHCIAKATLDGKEYFIELTDNYLPFASLPNNLVNAPILEIPQKAGGPDVELKPLHSLTRTKDVLKTQITLKLENSDLIVDVSTTKHGNLSSPIRSDYSHLEYDKQFNKIETACASNYKNVVLDTLSFSDLVNLEDSLSMRYKFRIKDEIAAIGTLRTFKLPFIDIVASLNKLASTSRTYAFNYNKYEDVDFYETVILVDVPAGKKLVELPSNETFSFGKMTYSITYTLGLGGELKVIRKFASDRNEIAAKDYLAFRTFVEKIVKAEQRMIAFQ